MSIIKELYDVAKDAGALRTKATAIKRALRTELKLNKKFLADVEKGREIDNERRMEILGMLEITELQAAVRYEIPYSALTRRKVTDELTEKYKVARIEGADVEQMIESLYLMISYLKKDGKNKNIHLNLRLINIYKYNRVLLELLK